MLRKTAVRILQAFIAGLMLPGVAVWLAASFLVGIGLFAMERLFARRSKAPQEVPPADERPHLPPGFKPRKHKAVKDRIAWRHAHPRDAEAMARHARQLHFHDQEIAEARHG